MRPPNNITTDRLHLRPPTLDDVDAVFVGYAQDPEVSRYMTWKPHRTIEETRTFLRMCIENWETGARFDWFITLRTNGRVIGSVGIRPVEPHPELGYVLARPHWRQGYMTEAVRGVLDWAFQQSDTDAVTALCDVDNGASAGLLRHLGFAYVGIEEKRLVHPNLSPELRDCLRFTLWKGAKDLPT